MKKILLWLVIFITATALLLIFGADRVSYARAEVVDLPTRFAELYGSNPQIVKKVIECESGGKMSAVGDSGHSRGIGQFQASTFDRMSLKLGEELNYDYILVKQAIYDYIFLGFLLGNDFIPSLPSVNLLNITKSLNGLEILMFYYSKIYEEIKESLVTYKNNKVTINKVFLLELFKNLTDCEEEYFKKSSYKKKYMNCQSNKPYDIEIFKLENLIFKISDPLELGKIDLNESKKRYYEYFKINDNVYFEYFKTLEWISYYYFDKCCDWLYIYPYENSPFVSDIYHYLQNNDITYCFPV
jgi:hypothetical protein